MSHLPHRLLAILIALGGLAAGAQTTSTAPSPPASEEATQAADTDGLPAVPESDAEQAPEAPPTLPPPLRSGPMLGPAEIADARIWLQTLHPAEIQLRFWPRDEPRAGRLSAEIRTEKASDLIALFELSGLREGTTYEYEIYADGERLDLPWARTFATQDLWQWRHDPPPVRIAVGSCAYINDPPADRPGTPYGSDFQIFDAIAATDPDVMVWLGDNIYLREPDFWSRASIRARHAQNRELPELRRLLASAAHYATWDDHDYGPNNSDRTYREKEAALEAFLDYFPNPGAGIPGADGVFTRFQWADLEVFLLDVRYHRTPPVLPRGMRRQMLGPEQLDWLIEGLASSNARFKLVAAGSQMLNPKTVDSGWFESFELYPEEKRRLLDALETLEVEGVVFLTGDRHHAELLRIDRGKHFYPLLELTASSLTAGLASPEPENPWRVPGTYTNAVHNFGLIDVDGPRRERRLTIRLMDDRGREVWRYEVPAGALEVPAEAELPPIATTPEPPPNGSSEDPAIGPPSPSTLSEPLPPTSSSTDS